MDEYIITHVEKMSSLIDSIVNDDELTDNDKVSIINSGIYQIQTKTYNIKESYRERGE